MANKGPQDIAPILRTMGLSDERCALVSNTILRRYTPTALMLRTYFRSWQIDEGLLPVARRKSIFHGECTEEKGQDYVDIHEPMDIPRDPQALQPEPVPPPQVVQATSPPAPVVMAPAAATTGPRVSFEDDMKDNPKLPKSKDLRGAVFDRWKQMVDAKMAQAGCKDIIDSSVPVPTYDEDDNRNSATREEEEEWNAKDGWV